MRAKDREAWLSRNVGKGGKRPSYDPFNKAKKGSERNKTAEEYASSNVEEYQRYPETKDTRKEDDQQKERNSNGSSSSQSSGRSGRAGNAGRAVSRTVGNIVARVVAVAVGGTIVVSGYQEMKAHEAAATVTEVEWVWSEDKSTVSAELLNGDGGLITELPAVINLVVTPATCSEEGLKTYTATARYGGKDYTETRTEVIPKEEHAFDEGTTIIHENGQIEVVFECEHCHEKINITLDPPEEE